MLAPCYLVYGGEPLQTAEIILHITNIANKEGYNKVVVYEVTAQFDWEELLNNCRNLDLFAERTLVELRLHNDIVSKKGDIVLNQILQDQDHSLCVVVRADKLKVQTLNSHWAQIIRKKGEIHIAKPITAELWPTWINKRLAKSGFTASQAAIKLLASCYEGNLMALDQLIKKMTVILPTGKLELEQIKPFIDNNSHYVVFELTDATLDGNTERTVHIFNSLIDGGIEPIMLLWAITNTIRTLILLQSKLQTGTTIEQAAKDLNIWRNNLNRFKKAADRLTIAQLEKLLHAAKNVDTMIKGMQIGDPREHLLSMYLILTGNNPVIMEELYI